MKQVVCTAPFTVEVRDVPKPEIERDGDVIIKVSTAGLCGSDLHAYRGLEPGGPMGHEVCGEIVAAGPEVKNAAFNARRLMDDGWLTAEQWSLADAEKGTAPKKGIAVVLGCGPVGLCAISSAKTLFETVYATDLNASRLPAAEKHGAIALPLPELKEALMNATEGRGADAVLEVVGHPSAVADALELVRPYGAVSSVGVHNAPLSVSAEKFYDKNVRMQFGRCSVRTFFPAAMNVLKGNLDLFRSFVQFKVGINEAPEYYTRFEKGEIGKTVFVM
ncbi:hypothetical protein A1Q1_05265 [Trichosporon asahii var. asahii CBS 2479]|uniref:Alcohol dehydrogenase n=1 Tax=Trichosporon asahii var. asahii (strain ATCC 90039 / CBS 2479 / JCM 2466 / KCTC 7840 / NBRC 103889/ NCYC 2677 / UAMH 7654) TaxID=1186058 RepID=J8TYY6_TRIAS|nr:hypothetical protein A1Q1_05265 [Trichosporon asahii var. asahii CBS 2479]EJT53302.1 hypothetical protein A1Q1_05265 [Trichosporon asahii var. asahii CBS 2479]